MLLPDFSYSVICIGLINQFYLNAKTFLDPLLIYWSFSAAVFSLAHLNSYFSNFLGFQLRNKWPKISTRHSRQVCLGMFSSISRHFSFASSFINAVRSHRFFLEKLASQCLNKKTCERRKYWTGHDKIGLSTKIWIFF